MSRIMRGLAAKIIAGANRVSKVYIWGHKTHSRFCPGKCLVCGEYFDVLTHNHAETHGYKDAYELMADGKVAWADDIQRKKGKQ